ncbi:TPA: ATP-binding protein [Stenotrophomonas maltophilia]|uniref:AAA family ATPase n=1 Tax=Stenotrophomonas maltophilia TaxID=40324 RepID=UPI0015E05621|nr:ATP-binding protein [Stenotrophomonas maltophilia]MBA0446901.1 ATP-binding protein [Stenotrophomonas maltophilia]HEL2977530.1 ATP-binding protein [Stenotrophomonas maltophilia]
MQHPLSTHGTPTLHLLCGKIGAGKSTLSQQLATRPHHVLISEDAWLAALYPGEIHSIADYLQRAATLRAVLVDHLRALLRARVSVVLDFPFNTPAARAWARDLFEPTGAAHELHFLDIDDDVCKARLRMRNARGGHPFQASDDEFEQITRHFVAPAAEEGFVVIRHTA